MAHISRYRTGIVSGIIAAICCIALIVCRYKYFGSNPQELGFATAAGFGVLIVIFFITAAVRRKELGGYATLKELFGTLFITILIAELAFAVFNYIYLCYIDPGFLARFAQGSEAWMQQTHVAEQHIAEFRKQMAAQDPRSLSVLAFGFARAVIVDSIAGIVIAFFMKKNKPSSL